MSSVERTVEARDSHLVEPCVRRHRMRPQGRIVLDACTRAPSSIRMHPVPAIHGSIFSNSFIIRVACFPHRTGCPIRTKFTGRGEAPFGTGYPLAERALDWLAVLAVRVARIEGNEWDKVGFCCTRRHRSGHSRFFLLFKSNGHFFRQFRRSTQFLGPFGKKYQSLRLLFHLKPCSSFFRLHLSLFPF